MKDQAVAVRAALEASGLDHGPISVFDKMMSMGMDAPSIASLARIFRQRGAGEALGKGVVSRKGKDHMARSVVRRIHVGHPFLR